TTHAALTYAASFSLHCRRHHQALHSFPTRRSSDLERAARAMEIFRVGVREPARANLDVVRQTYELGSKTLLDYIAEQRQDLLWRSEEHTSELQSLRHLVCRLLLEKKKTYISPSDHT